MNFLTKLCTISPLVFPWSHKGNWTSHPVSVSVLLFSLNLKGKWTPNPVSALFFLLSSIQMMMNICRMQTLWIIHNFSLLSPFSFPSFSLLHCGELHLLHNRPLSISRLSRLFLHPPPPHPPLFNLASFCELFSTSMRFNHQRAGQVGRTALTSLSVLGLTSFTSNWDNAIQKKNKTVTSFLAGMIDRTKLDTNDGILQRIVVALICCSQNDCPSTQYIVCILQILSDEL